MSIPLLDFQTWLHFDWLNESSYWLRAWSRDNPAAPDIVISQISPYFSLRCVSLEQQTLVFNYKKYTFKCSVGSRTKVRS